MDAGQHNNPSTAVDRTSRPVRKEDRWLTERARELRKRAPIPERLLWGLLRDRRLNGLKFRRQVPIGPYVIDYYCAECALIVELDGRSHDGRLRDDLARQVYLEERGLRVVRVTNDDVIADVTWVGEQVLRASMIGPSGEAASGDVRPSPRPSPQGGEGAGAQACP